MFDIDFGSQTEVRYNEPLSKHSSFRIGGAAKYAVFPKSAEKLLFAVGACKRNGIKYKIIGNASNILFDDMGYDGAIIFTTGMNNCEYIHTDGQILVKVDCGRSLSELAYDAGKRHCLTGLEFAYGIPGTIGGAVYMNAGAYGGQMSDLIVKTEYIDTRTDNICTIDKNGLDFSYRHSIFQDHPEHIIISATLKLTEGNSEEIFSKMSEYMASRREKQPLEFPNAGSIFKRPGNNVFAGKLIEDCRLKGFMIGGAQISEKHAGFIVNKGGATSKDVLDLIEHTQKTVFEKFNIKLECEIIHIV